LASPTPSNTPQIESEFISRIDEFARHYLSDPQLPPNRPKIIHDPLWGTQRIEAWEIAILDTPLMQRLRQIKQTGLAHFTYPSAAHSRFEHTLGVLYQVEKLFCALKMSSDANLFDDQVRKDLRLAAILHDCGHGPFSHSSEDIYRFSDDMATICGRGTNFEGKSPHEVLSWHIVKSQSFKDFITDIENKYNFCCDLDFIANSIIGKASAANRNYLTEIINGPFDADKLDYIYRDSYFSGIPLSVDLARLWHSCTVLKINDKRILGLRLNGMAPLEQILFSKITLFSTVYHHHKVRASDCLLYSIMDYIRKNGGIQIGDKKIELKHATDFLWLTDDILFSLCRFHSDEALKKLINKLAMRRLPKRALIISRSVVEDTEEENYQDLMRLTQFSSESLEEKKQTAEEIWEEAGKPCGKNEIWIDLPKKPPSSEPSKTFIVDAGGDFVKLEKIFPFKQWIDSYIQHKWRGHVFCFQEHSDKISQAAKNVLEKKYSIKLKDIAICNSVQS
jgi:HD superfamily phosphohydrolase